jgi:hypothetical protein
MEIFKHLKQNNVKFNEEYLIKICNQFAASKT